MKRYKIFYFLILIAMLFFYLNYPLDKVVELYERLVQSEKEKVEYLENIIKGK